MDALSRLKTLGFAALMGLGLMSVFPAYSDDIDIFMGVQGVDAQNPNILIVLDNTSNWSRQSQHWPDQDAQGQSEVNAIKRAIANLDENINVGLFEFVTQGNANDDGGYVRHHISPMNDANKTALSNKLQTIFDNIEAPIEKRNSNTAYGNLMYDVYNYLSGGNAFTPGATPGTLADAAGYTSPYTQFKAPLTADNTCANTIIIFIGNSDSNGPETDTATNTTALSNLGGNTTQLLVPEFTTTQDNTLTNLGYDSSCVSNAKQCSTADFSAECGVGGSYDSCACNGSDFTTATCSGNKKRYMVQGVIEKFVITPTNTYAQAPKSPVNADEWSRFFHQVGVSVSNTDIRQVSTYTIDVFNDAQNADQTALLMSMARVGGGKYFAARNEDAIVDALLEIISEIQAVNSTFAAASLPVNATNRAQNENQVFIGMFRPDKAAKPRWFGNMKRYQIINNAGRLDLGDVDGNPAISSQTGFLNECATSYWTSDSGNYWENVPVTPSPMGQCPTTNFNAFSDSPDGPRVEKGGAAQVIRNGNNPPATDTTPTYTVNRDIKTLSAGNLVQFNVSSSGLDAAIVDFAIGKDTENELGLSTPNTSKTRPSLHGDVVHSRPLPLNYGGTTGVVVYYGSNDGTFRAVEADSGKELWAFVAPEFHDDFERLKDNEIKVSFPGNTTGTPTPEPKDYHFDGSTGVYQNADSSDVWIFPSMRRGGRMVYGLDVTDPLNPVYKWRAGCPNMDNDTGCTTGMTAIGQTWSRPSVAFIKGNSTTVPVIVMGGGYDTCMDEDDPAPSCGAGDKGNAVYVLNADTGALIKSFSTTSPVSADIAMLDANQDGFVDYAYAADTGGKIYRISFANPLSNPPHDAESSVAWGITTVATTGGGRKFLYGPALVQATSNILYLALGTGDREHPLHFQYTKDITNRFFVFKDDLNLNTTVDLDTLTNYTASTNCDDDRILPGSASKGWFMDLTSDGKSATGEQTVTSAVVAGGLVIFSTNRAIPPDQGTCSTNLGEARGYIVDLLNASGAIGVQGSCGGTRSTVYTGAGLPPSPVLATVPIDGVLTTVIIGAPQKDGSASSPIGVGEARPTITSPRQPVYWYKSSGVE